MSANVTEWYTIDAFNINAVGEWHEMESKIVTFPPNALSAEEVQFYLKGDPATSNYRLIDRSNYIYIYIYIYIFISN